MSTAKAFLRATLICIAALGTSASGLAQQTTGEVRRASLRDTATYKAILEALMKRRAEVDRSTKDAHKKRAALAFLDTRIAQVRSQMAK